MTRRLDFFARDGRPCVGELALPTDEGRAPAVLVVHEWWGLNDDIRRLTERFAQEGFVALAVDLYGGRVSTDREGARALAEALTPEAALSIMGGAIDRMASHPRAQPGPMGIVGFCLGGAMALLAAAHLDGLGAAVPFYGIPKAPHDWSQVRAAVQAHFGATDPKFPVPEVQALEQAMRAAGVDVTLHLYDAGHAFMREGSELWVPQAARVAWARTVQFLRERLVS